MCTTPVLPYTSTVNNRGGVFNLCTLYGLHTSSNTWGGCWCWAKY